MSSKYFAVISCEKSMALYFNKLLYHIIACANVNWNRSIDPGEEDKNAKRFTVRRSDGLTKTHDTGDHKNPFELWAEESQTSITHSSASIIEFSRIQLKEKNIHTLVCFISWWWYVFHFKERTSWSFSSVVRRRKSPLFFSIYSVFFFDKLS